MYFLEAARVLLENRTRSILTIIGLVVGVAAIVSIQVAASGMSAAVFGIFKGANAGVFFVHPKTSQANISRANFKYSDMAAIRDNVPGVIEVIPGTFGNVTMIYAGHKFARLKLGGESDKRFSTSPIAAGHAITADDVASASAVCVISNDALNTLFPGQTPQQVIGKSVYAASHRYVIVGVLGVAKLNTTALGFDVTDDVDIPYTTFYNNYQRGSKLFALQALAAQSANLHSVEARTVAFLEAAHPGAQYETFDFGFVSQTINVFFAIIGGVVGALGAISLVVAGIGIMNIMLVSVTERTREIGIRKAIGARRGQILAQFFVESLLLSGAGCAIGLLLGIGLGAIADVGLIARLSGVTGGIPWVEVSIIAAGFAIIVTVCFGTYPAYRAAGLDPIEALRYE